MRYCSMLLVFSLLGSWTFTQAQVPDSLPYHVAQHLYYARYPQVIALADAALQVRQSQAQSPAYATALATKGWIQLQMHKFPLADSLLRRAIHIYENYGTLADSNLIKAYAWLINVYRFTGKKQRVDSLLQKASVAAQKCIGTPHAVHQSTLLMEAFYHDIDMWNYKAALEKQTKLIALAEKQWGAQHPRVAMVLQATVNSLKNVAPATKEAQLLKAKAILEQHQKRYPWEYAATLSALADLYSEMSLFKKSFQVLQTAKAFVKASLGSQHPQYAWVIRNIGGHQQNYSPQFKEVKLLYQEALGIYYQHFGEKYGAYTGALQDLSGWYGDLGRTDSASYYREKAYRLSIRTYGERSYSAIKLGINYARDLHYEGRALEADSLLEHVDTLCRSLYGGRINALAVDILEERISLFHSQGDFQASNSAFEAAQKILEQLYGPSSIETLRVKFRLALDYDHAGQLQKGDSLFQRSLTQLKTIKGTLSWDYAFQLSQYHYILKEIDKKKAKACLLESSQIFEQLFGLENFWGIFNLDMLINLQLELKEYTAVESSFKVNEQRIKMVYGDTSAAMKSLLGSRARLLKLTRPPIEAIPLQQQLIELNQALGADNSINMKKLDLASTLREIGDPQKAEELAQEALGGIERKEGKSSINYLLGLFTNIEILRKNAKYPQALQRLEEFEGIMREMGNPPFLVNAYLVTKANYFNDVGNSQEAINAVLERMQKPGYTIKHGDYNQWGVFLQDAHQYHRADSVLRLGIRLAVQNNEPHGFLLGNLAVNYIEQGLYHEALAQYPSILSESLKKNGYYSSSMGTDLFNIAVILSTMNRLQEAEDTLKSALRIYQKLGDQLKIAEALNLLNDVHTQQDQLSQAGKDILEAVAIAEQKLGSTHPTTLHFKQNLASHYVFVEQFETADSLFSAIMQIRKEKGDESNQNNNFLLLYGSFLANTIGEYDRALSLMQNALEISIRRFPEGHPHQADIHRGLGQVLLLQKDYTQAKVHFNAALALYQKFFSPQHTFLADVYRKLGDVERRTLNFQEAAQHYKNALQTFENTLGPDHYKNALVLEAQMRLNELQGNYEQAEALGQRCMRIVEKTRGRRGEDYAVPAVRLASLLYRKQDTLAANALMTATQATIHAQTKRLFTYITPSRQSNILDRFEVLDCYPTFLEDHPNDSLAKMCFDNTLLIQGSILDNSRSLRQSILNTRDSSLLRLLDDYLAAEAILTDVQKNQAQEPAKIEIARQKVQNLEETLRRKSPDFEQYSKSFELSWRDVQKALKPDEAAVMYLSYKHYRVEQSDSVRYAAMVLRPGWRAPRFFPLVAESAIAKMVSDQASRGEVAVKNIYDLPPTQRSQSGTSVVKDPSIYQLIWAPLEQSLQGVKKVYFSSTGLLHRFNLGALPIKQTKYGATRISDQPYEIQQLRSLRHLLQVDEPKSAGINSKTALIAGWVDFGGPIITWDTLYDETPKCDTLLRIQNYKVNYLYAKNASTKNVIQALQKSPAPSIIHFATHGYFAPNLGKSNPIPIRIDSSLSAEKKVRRNTSADPNSYLPKSWQFYPMMRSGLVLAGANMLDSSDLQKGKNPYLLTAQDIAALNLKGTELVVLSACETGLGDVFNNEGVYGLQRAFLQAGAKQVIMSLWQVDDATTSTFMTKFYRAWLGGKILRQALTETQEAMRWYQEDGVNKEHQAYRWAGFVLIE